MPYILTQEGYLEILATDLEGGGSGDLLADGSVPMTADWDLGEFTIQVDTVSATAATGLRLSDDSDTLGIFIEDGGNVGVGVADPERKFHIVGPEGQVVAFPANLGGKDYLVVENNDNCNIAVVLGADKAGGLKFYEDGEADFVAGVTYLCTTEQLKFYSGGGTVHMRLDGSGTLFIGDEENAKMTIGLTINQGANDDEILALKSSDVAHGMTDETETDTYFLIKKRVADGGARLIGIVDAGSPAITALELRGLVVGDADTTKGITARAILEGYCTLTDGAGYGNVNANGNIVAFRSKYDGASQTRWMVDTHGKTWQGGSLTIGSRELTQANLTALLDGGETALHSHAGGGGGGAATDITVADDTLDKFLAAFDDETDDLQDLIEMVDEQAVEVIQSDGEPGTTYPGMIWVDTDADPAGSNTTSFIQDDDQDTKVECEEGGDDEDKIRFDAGGSEVGIWDAVSLSMPLQPAFFVTLGIADSNFAINTNHVTEVDTEVYDIGENFDTGTFTFTAPVDGKYILTATWRLGVTLDNAAQFYEVRILTSNRSYVTLLAPKWSSDPNYHAVHVSVVADMDANDTAFLRHYQQGGSAQTDVSINETRFGGIKVA